MPAMSELAAKTLECVRSLFKNPTRGDAMRRGKSITCDYLHKDPPLARAQVQGWAGRHCLFIKWIHKANANDRWTTTHNNKKAGEEWRNELPLERQLYRGELNGNVNIPGNTHTGIMGDISARTQLVKEKISAGPNRNNNGTGPQLIRIPPHSTLFRPSTHSDQGAYLGDAFDLFPDTAS